MALAEVDLYNLALRHVGVGVEVQATTENSAAANACRRFFEQVRNETLSEFAWPFATKTDTLALVATDPTEEWGFAYEYPVDALQLQRIISGIRTETSDERIPYAVRYGDSGNLIYTDLKDAEMQYTVVVEDTARFSSLFGQAVAFKLGFYIAPSLTAGDPYKLGNRAFELYQQTLERARDQAVDEEQADPQPESEFIRARD